MSQKDWILLVDDDAHDADLTLRVLAEDGEIWDIRTARDGQEVVDLLNGCGDPTLIPAVPPALVLLDLNMPRVGGLELLRQLKSHAQWRFVPVVMFTSSRDEADVVRCYDLGANAYVVKQVDFKQFVAALKSIKAFWMGTNEAPAPGAASAVPKAASDPEAAPEKPERLIVGKVLHPERA